MNTPEERLRQLADALEPSADDVARVLARVVPRPARRAHVPLRVGVPLVLAAAALLVWGIDRSTDRPVPLHGSVETRVLEEGLDVRTDGSGVWLGHGVIRWDSGRLTATVDPNAHLDVSVRTAEAEVHVVGTVFVVDRGSFGTTVEVSRGRVDVACADGAELQLAPGARAFCPADAAGALGFVLQHPDEASVLELTARGLRLPGSEAVHGELRAAQVGAYLDLGRTEEAFAAGAALVGDTWTIRAVRQRLVTAASNCAQAVPVLRALLPDPGAAIRLADCTTDPAERRRVLEAALPGASPEVARAIEDRLR